MKALTVGSLFSGIGGLELGFERAGFEVRWQVEIDEWARRVLAKHWPDVPKYADVREVGAHNLMPVDVIVGGFPCQDISNAGKRAGITGERSGLWSEYARIVGELRPRYVVVENVAAILHRGLDRVLADLAACGYDAEWQVLPASAFGAPHKRERIFLVGYSDYYGQPTSEISQGSDKRGHRHTSGAEQLVKLTGPGCQGQAYVAHTYSQLFPEPRRARDGRAKLSNGSWWAVEPNVGRVANGVPRRVDRLRGLGNAVVPQVAQYVAECVLQHAQATEEEQAA